jgi:hypothetical protein
MTVPIVVQASGLHPDYGLEKVVFAPAQSVRLRSARVWSFGARKRPFTRALSVRRGESRRRQTGGGFPSTDRRDFAPGANRSPGRRRQDSRSPRAAAGIFPKFRGLIGRRIPHWRQKGSDASRTLVRRGRLKRSGEIPERSHPCHCLPGYPSD